MIDQLKTVRQMLKLMAGQASVDELRQQVIKDAMEKDIRRRHAAICVDELSQQVIKDAMEKDIPYETLKPQDKAGCDEAVAGMQEIAGVFDDIVKLKAAMTYKFYKALQMQGFTPEEAIAITAAQPVEVKGG